MSIKTSSFTGDNIVAQPSASDPLDKALNKAIEYLLSVQYEDGCWLGELEGDTILESEYIILMRFLGRTDEIKLKKLAAYIKSKQMANGGWAIFPDGPVDVSSSVKAYFALKMTGTAEDEPYMLKAREAIHQAGGIPATNSYTKFYLAMLGQIEWHDAPAVPAEMMLLPKWFYFNIYEISSWSRTFVVPLSIIWAHKLVVQLPDEHGIGELLTLEQRKRVRPRMSGFPISWHNFFLTVDSAYKLCERIGFLPFKKKAVTKAEEWLVEHCDKSAGLGAIFPPMVYALIAMKSLDYPDDHPLMQWELDELEKLEIEEDGKLRLQPCISPVWDTAIAINALVEAGLNSDHPSLKKSAEWIVSKQVRERGDWQVKKPHLEPGGWYFELANEFYPDIDDTAMVLMALEKVGNVPGKQEACQKAFWWLLGMQSKDGGWASFDADNNKRIFNHIPFADHNAMLDPSTSDITARILEMFSFYGFNHRSRVSRRAIEFMKKEQERDGSWYGRWGVNYVYGTWQALRGLTRIGIPIDDPAIRRGTDWLLSVQNEDGGWGENCISYYNPCLKGEGPSTASQTAWAIMGLICAGESENPAVEAGVNYLLQKQGEDGTWDEDEWTGAGFPKVFFLKYHLYRHSFPTMALGMYRRTIKS